MASILTGHVTHGACLGCSGSAYTTACSSSCQYPATSYSHWRWADQHPTGHNQQPDQLYAKEMANGGHTRYWLVFGPPTNPPNTIKLHILEWPFIVASPRHTFAIIMLSNQHLDMPHLWGGWIILAKEKCSLTQLGLGLVFLQTSQVLPHWLNHHFSLILVFYTETLSC